MINDLQSVSNCHKPTLYVDDNTFLHSRLRLPYPLTPPHTQHSQRHQLGLKANVVLMNEYKTQELYFSSRGMLEHNSKNQSVSKKDFSPKVFSEKKKNIRITISFNKTIQMLYIAP